MNNLGKAIGLILFMGIILTSCLLLVSKPKDQVVTITEFPQDGVKVSKVAPISEIEPFKLQLKMIGSKYCVEYYFYDEDNLPVQSFAFVIATSDEEAIQKAQNYSTSKITIISCTKYA